MADLKNYTRPSFVIKVLEMVLGAVCVGLIAGRGTAIDITKVEVVHAVYFGFFIVTCIVVVSYILDAPIHGKLMMVIAAAGAVLYFTAGALNLQYYDRLYKDKNILAAGIVGLLNGLLHAIDVFFSWKG